MSHNIISNVIETHLSTMTGSIGTAFENVKFSPVPGVPYQAIDLLFATPENPTFGDQFHRVRGIANIQLRYPINSGRADALAYGELIKARFFRGLTLSDSGINVIIESTPELAKAGSDGDRYLINIRIRFFVNLEG